MPPISPPRRASAAFMRGHPARGIALGFGSGLSPVAPGTVGTLWAWVAFLVLDRWLSPAQWALVLLLSFAVGLWACTRTAQAMGTADPGAIVWDEVLAFWLVLWLVLPAGLLAQTVASRCSASSTPPSRARWAGPTGCSSRPPAGRSAGRKASASSSTTSWRPCARCS